MSIDVFTCHFASLPAARLVGFKGTEALSRPFEFDIFFTVPVGTDVRAAIGSRATLSMDRKTGAAMHWQGVLVRFRLLHETRERALYQGLLVPKLWLLRHFVRSFVHTKKALDVFATKTLEHGGLTREFHFSIDKGRYPQEEFVCQYRESDLDFINRWLEREGPYYYFDHPEGDGEAEVMTIVDDKSQHHPLLGEGRVRYFPSAAADVAAGECFREIHVDFQSLPATVLVTDYNYANPAAPLSGEHPVSDIGKGQIREYGYRVFNQGEAARLAEVKSQSMACRELTLHAVGNAMGIRAGYVFEIEDGPSDIPHHHLAIEVRHAGTVAVASQDVSRYTGLNPNETYRVEVTAIPADVQFRAPQTTPWPRIYGVENGIVDGAAQSQYAQIDDQGRYLVRFKFDASDLPDGSTSTYLRMMQPHGGTIEGFHFPLRKGTEVMVSFQGGDPDRPLIAGVVPNAHRPSTVTNRNFTQNVLRTGNRNHMVIEDLEGKEHIDLFTPVGTTNIHMGGPSTHSFIVPPLTPNTNPALQAVNSTFYLYTDGTAGFNVTEDWWQIVGGDYKVDVSSSATIHYVGVHTLNIDSDSNEFYNAHQNIVVHAGRTDKVEGGGMTQDIHGGLTQTIEPGGKQEVTGPWTHKVTALNHDDYGQWKTDVKGPWDAKIGATWTHTVTSNIKVESTGGTIDVKSPTKITLDAPAVKITAVASIHKHTNLSFETFISKNSLGVQKLDITGISVATNGLKVETTGYAAALVGVKGETVGAKKDTFGAVFTTLGAHLWQAAIEVGTANAQIYTAGFTKF